MIRAATHADVERVVDLGQILHASSDFAPISYDRDKVSSLMHSLINGAGVLFVAEREGVVIGGIAGAITTYWFSEEFVGFDYSFFLEPTQRNGFTALKLINAFKIWCKGRGATRLKMGITTGLNVEKISRFYLLAGFNYAGPLFEMEL
ncbi:GNAT family N-acetyltransferase [Herbaspirillum autotrophicum]|uniref:GNAT family N-acetyltransferase n=1 Tax=Herbaspirillum autotrophicum TaxID=180195 RepID=UPI00067E268D|nr:GNAT family N-acetyltransferase [Herbaspirillum autotrophicum]